MSDYSQSIARTILDQLGGNKFIAVAGVKDIAYGGDTQEAPNCYVTFKIGSNSEKITHVSVLLAGDDTYTVTFLKVPKHTLENVENKKEIIKTVFSEIYCDMLQELFEENTGLDLSLARVFWNS